ncbi:MAG TPA: hypothetical protein PLL30_08875 [Candidatus Krumholzibacteria bacterium]|nr:hypothetical protein [Candidatus Krumholzibacteria bacterium]HPD71872.1 hypothetical protein [Candidatus Krumholzibacteria bacterium]HRY41195.1 hypothetical protein [Candidatus Krumholzibacteria bacterium]
MNPPLSPLSTIQDVAAAIARTAGPQLAAGVPPARRGLYLATGDAGVDVAVAFWAAALEASPRFANPADFPWTLANAPAGLVARALQIQGPCHTLVGGADALAAALAHADGDLARGRVREALVVACDLAHPLRGSFLVLNETRRARPAPAAPASATAALLACGGQPVARSSAAP